MKNLFFAFTFAILFSSASAFAQIVPIREDFQIWNETSIAFPILKAKDKKGKEFDRLTFLLNGTLRFGRNASRPVDERIGVGLSYRFNKYLSFSPDYLYRAVQPYQGVSQFEHRVRFSVTPENKWNRFSLVNRNQIEFRIRHFQKNSVRYKNRIRFDYPLKKNNKEIFSPFAANEITYDFSAKKLTRNQFFGGISKPLNKKVSAEFYYLFVKDRGFPKIINGFGINFRFKSNLFLLK